jgi:hypothetical protein
VAHFDHLPEVVSLERGVLGAERSGVLVVQGLVHPHKTAGGHGIDELGDVLMGVIVLRAGVLDLNPDGDVVLGGPVGSAGVGHCPASTPVLALAWFRSRSLSRSGATTVIQTWYSSVRADRVASQQPGQGR